MPNASTGEGWDEEFRAGRWDFLTDIKETARTGIIAGWLCRSGCGRRVLDVGCGEAVLLPHLDQARLERYVGVDLSAEALARATVPAGRGRLVAADLESFTPEPGESFTAIVFNEVLHFAADPGAALCRYRPFLADGGVIAVSMYAPWKESGGGYAKVREMESATDGAGWRILDSLELVSAAKNVRWRLRLIAPVE